MKFKNKMSIGYYIMLMFVLCIILRMFLEGFYDGLTAGEGQEQLIEGTSYLWKEGVRGFLFDIGSAGMFAYLVHKKVSTPFKNLVENMNRIAAGDLNTRISMDYAKEIYSIANAFNVMADNLQKVQEDRVKMEENNRLLYSNIAHDLKSPMTMIIGYSKLVQEDNLPEEKKREYLKTICEQSVHMNGLLDAMLSFTKLQNNAYKIVPEKRDVAEILRKCIAQYYLMFEENDLKIEIDIPDRKCMCMVDETELCRAFRNLISNMAVHTERGTECRILLEETSEKDRVNIYFADGGDALPDIVKENLFMPFCVGDESRNTKGGSGLGLSIVKKIIERHGGTVHYIENWENGMKAFVTVLVMVSD